MLERLVADDAAMIMTTTPEEMESVGFSQFSRSSLGNVQGVYATETNPADGSYDAAIDEILHLVTQKGYGRVFPELDDSKLVTGNVLSDAMDAARGGRFPGGMPLDAYPAAAWYSYNDVTCTSAARRQSICTGCSPPTSTVKGSRAARGGSRSTTSRNSPRGL